MNDRKERRVGAKPKTKDKKASKQVATYLTNHEFAMIEKIAEEEFLSMSSFLRKIISQEIKRREQEK